MNGLFEKHKYKKLNEVQYIACGFAMLILIGAFLLMLPFSTRAGETTTLSGALFTATSAVCVTGLVVYDTYTHWTLFGQSAILLMIQIGGLGFITIGVAFSIAFQKRIGLRQRDLLKESISAMEIGNVLLLWKNIIIGTLIIEGLGMLFLSLRFVPEFGWRPGLFFGLFHSVSAFCNGGFDLMGIREPFSSVTAYSTDPLVIPIFCLLILIGGLGFTVWRELWEYKWHAKHYSLHTKLTLSMLVILVFGGTFFLWILERHNTLVNQNISGQFLLSLFGAVTPRTAGFNSVDTATLTPGGKLFTIILMFIGGGAGSTAGGIKVTTFAVIILYIFSSLRNESGCNVFHRRIDDVIIKKACLVASLNLGLALLAALFLMAVNPLSLEDALFESISAISTVGMTTGITRSVSTSSQLVLMLLMYMGRIGSVTFALSFIQRSAAARPTLPAERINIG